MLILVLVTLQINNRLCSFEYPVKYSDTVIFCLVEGVVSNVQSATKSLNVIAFQIRDINDQRV